MDFNKLLEIAINASIDAGKAILEVYEQDDFGIQQKQDNSPLTLADLASNKVILEYLKKENIPILSEEEKNTPYAERKDWTAFWLVDPLDGTKEFIKRNGDFTVNIALVCREEPILGVVFVPVTGELYFASKEVGAYKYKVVTMAKEQGLDQYIGKADKLPLDITRDYIAAVGSRSHMSGETMVFINQLKKKYKNVEIVQRGSALKLCMVAEGKADVYPRLGPTMEWDTAAGHAIVLCTKGKIVLEDLKSDLVYNKENLLNPYFIVTKEGFNVD